MPKRGTLKPGKETENFLTGKLVEALHDLGVTSAGFERVFKVRKGGKETVSKPDVSFSNGGIHIVSAKFGARRELEAYKSADEYKEDLAPSFARTGEVIGEVFAVTYPAARNERFHLHALPTPTHGELSFTLVSIEEVASQMKATVDGLIEASRLEPLLDEAHRMLRWGAEDLAGSLKGVTLGQLEALFGGHDFFESLLKPRLVGENKADALRLGAAYLFVNQLLFYVLLSQAEAHHKRMPPTDYPEIRSEHFRSPMFLQRHYFDRVRSRNYEPIYGIEITELFKGVRAEEACDSLVRAMLALAPKLTVPDLVGQVFQTLIPLEIRKPLGSYYTNPAAAELLARLTIVHSDDRVLDPACGSGTLLVAAYRQKKMLSSEKNDRKLHKRFVEKEITGIDAMAFSAHLAAVNLALQQPLMDTEHVRIGIADSTSQYPGTILGSTESTLPRELHQVKLEHNFDKPRTRARRGVVRVSKGDAREFSLELVDVVIMNPPFTSWDNMGEDYRESLKKSFAMEKPAYRKIVYWKVSQQAFFLLLADRFLKPGGFVGAVLPITTFTGQAFSPLMDYFLDNYTVKAIVVGLGRTAFSEDTSLGECLFIAQKRKPPKNSEFVLIGTRESPNDWTSVGIDTMIGAAESRLSSTSGLVTVREFRQELLSPQKDSLPGLMFRLYPEYDKAMTVLDSIMCRSDVNAVPFRNLGISLKRWTLGGGWLVHFGSKALFGYRGENRAVKSSDRLVIAGENKGRMVLKDKVTGHAYEFSTKSIVPALRRFSYLTSFDASRQSDVAVIAVVPALEMALKSFYSEKDSEEYIKRIEMLDRKTGKGKWETMVHRGLTTLAFAGRLDFAAKGTTVVCCRSDKPMLLAAYGFMASGDFDVRVEKYLCLWFNSTVSLLQLMGKLTLTRGTWVRIEQYVLDPSLIPDFRHFNEDDWRLVESLYDDLKGCEFPNLVDQLKGHPVREALDNGILRLLGVSEQDAIRLGPTMRKGVLEVIENLQRSMLT